ncbi:conserved hypothetical protein [Methanococcus vannielii SB]|uniref:Uncharacterized protein n=1 Tax=Methanococcus vannielii (strain ATCC 35089 / DSM 1224 / JCM 13029 / OCM 148 / SB) TaxID=406327 RepID=A6USU9_METVS|nr:hypothetical protein [Methanococcus vannielii]ABR55571.1 conserved hypothetical protein [Methanococcus vannielii SB]
MKKIVLGAIISLALISVVFAYPAMQNAENREFKGKYGHLNFENMTYKESQEFKNLTFEKVKNENKEEYNKTLNFKKFHFINFENMTYEEIQDALKSELLVLEEKYKNCEKEQTNGRIEEKIQLIQDLINNPEKLEEIRDKVPKMNKRQLSNGKNN